ncbi:MAG TPA: septal ring lytic transglycosylase RlpA family protein [Rubrobacteraceae bacterium]|nr:septal ring lytic transglycosylase RlpA family protein [Rubrobacteraceae bacterium]
MVLGLMLLGAIFLLWNADHERVREVSGIRHSAVTGAPQAPSGNGGEGKMMDASYYGHELEGSPTASGQPFDPEKYTAASKTLPLGTKLKVSHGGESVRVTVNDRGPYVPGRELDLSLAAARKIGLTGQAEAPVRVVVL